MQRAILHCDLNNFYASVECKLCPSLRGIPIAVGGDISNRHGIILAKNELAKAKGVKTAQTIHQAKMACPSLTVVPPHFDRYLYYSGRARKIFEEYTDCVEPFGMDESWLDVTGSSFLGSPQTIADALREQFRSELGLTVSVGVSFNKVFAKLGSDLKKPDATTVISKENFKEVVWPLPVDAMIGVGEKTASLLTRHRIRTIGELACVPEGWLFAMLGKSGPMLRRYAAGQENSPVVPAEYVPPLKSIGRGITTAQNLTNDTEAMALIGALCEKVGARLRGYGMYAGGLCVEVKTNRLTHHSFQCRLCPPCNKTRSLSKQAYALFASSYRWKDPIRAVSVRVFDLCSAQAAQAQPSLFAQEPGDLSPLEKTVDALQKRFGKDVLQPAVLLQNRKFSLEQDFEIALPGSTI